MPQITRINVHIVTGTGSGADTNGDVYLGVCGREFYIDSEENDNQEGDDRTYVLGDEANVLHPDINDPREQILLTENVEKFPVYIRFQPRGRNDHWQLQRADVRFNDTAATEWDTISFVHDDPKKGIWLGVRSGMVVHLAKNRA